MTATATWLNDILDRTLLGEMVTQGFVRVQQHPTLPLAVYNYTEACQYAGAWNPVTLACRGLIVDLASGAVIARPFAKFFNHGQPGAPVLDLTEPVVVTDKMDGSLGVLYPAADDWAVATRGSFVSEQAAHATALLRTRYPGFTPPAGVTVLVEIVYPANRIVVDYRGLDDLVLLGGVDIATGRTFGPDSVPAWPGPVVERFALETLAQALAAPPRPDREGLVVHALTSDVRVKIKYEEYVRLHRAVTGLTARMVWEHLVDGSGLAPLIEALPDEFHTWVRQTADGLANEVDQLATAIEAAYESIVDDLPEGFTRKDFAMRAAKHPERGCLFLRLDGRDYRSQLWQRVRPAGGLTPYGRSLDAEEE